ncbi:MAG: glycosyl transferase family 1, partial [Flavobacteriales bacterium]|nr:glycosyl transferase family 1 [Flavobacteriales bacterium]
MKKVLVITYYWPPDNSAGVYRWLKFVKYLRFNEWEPIVYTALHEDNIGGDASVERDVPEGVEILRQPCIEPFQIFQNIISGGKSKKVQPGFVNKKKGGGLVRKFLFWIRGNFFIPDARKYWIKPSAEFLIEYLKTNKVDLIVSTGPP